MMPGPGMAKLGYTKNYSYGNLGAKSGFQQHQQAKNSFATGYKTAQVPQLTWAWTEVYLRLKDSMLCHFYCVFIVF